MLIDVQTSECDGAIVVAVRGELDIATAPELATALTDAMAGARRLVVDLSGTQFLDSTATRTLVTTTREAGAGGVTTTLVCPASNRNVRRVLDFMGIEAVIPVFDSVQAAAHAES